MAMGSKPVAVTSVADLVYHACFDLGVPWHSEICSVYIHSKRVFDMYKHTIKYLMSDINLPKRWMWNRKYIPFFSAEIVGKKL